MNREERDRQEIENAVALVRLEDYQEPGWAEGRVPVFVRMLKPLIPLVVFGVPTCCFWSMVFYDPPSLMLLGLTNSARCCFEDADGKLTELELHRRTYREVWRAEKPARKFERDEQGYILDWWGTRFQIGPIPRGKRTVLRVRSAGVDRRFGTGDDVISDQIAFSWR